jgi:3-oxoacyl-[acyl-carrier-protein] synthase III
VDAELIERGSTAEPGFHASDLYDCSGSVAGLNCIVQELREGSARAHRMVVANTLTQIVTQHSRNIKSMTVCWEAFDSERQLM